MKVLRVVLALVMLSSLALAQEPQEEVESEKESLKGKGFFIGIDIESVKADTSMENKVYSFPSKTDNYTEPAFKLGYQYYFTRIYFKYSTVAEKTDDYTIDSTSYELNVEYIPILYRDNSYAVRLITGLAVGYTDNDLKNLSLGFSDSLGSFGVKEDSQKEAIYGVQIGLMLEMSMGLSAEVGYRYRRGNLLEFQNDSGDTTFETKRKQIYLGLNYMF